jgi:hypothetical protein
LHSSPSFSFPCFFFWDFHESGPIHTLARFGSDLNCFVRRNGKLTALHCTQVKSMPRE